MRLKKHLDERIAECRSVLLAREGDDFYKLTDEQKRAVRIDLNESFANCNPLTVEIGCGKGAWAIQSATLHPERNYIAVEKLSNVIVVGCEKALEHNLPNLKFLNCRAENLHLYLPPHTVSQIALNFSCPFPKKTYANRRLTSRNYLELYKGLLSGDGVVCQKTDDLNFFVWSQESLTANNYEVYDVCYDLPVDADGNIVTEYEAKFRALGKPIYSLKAKIKTPSI